jgi:hypothetical protein
MFCTSVDSAHLSRATASEMSAVVRSARWRWTHSRRLADAENRKQPLEHGTPSSSLNSPASRRPVDVALCHGLRSFQPNSPAFTTAKIPGIKTLPLSLLFDLLCFINNPQFCKTIETIALSFLYRDRGLTTTYHGSSSTAPLEPTLTSPVTIHTDTMQLFVVLAALTAVASAAPVPTATVTEAVASPSPNCISQPGATCDDGFAPAAVPSPSPNCISQPGATCDDEQPAAPVASPLCIS